MAITPPPLSDTIGSVAWLDWFMRVNALVDRALGSAIWADIDFTDSDLADIQTRNHNDLQTIQGGSVNDHYHLTQAQQTALTGGTTTSVHLHQVRIKDFAPASITVNTGTPTAGAYTDLAAPGGTLVVITEVTGSPGFDVEIAFSGVSNPFALYINGYYNGSAVHNVDIDVWNATTSAWDKYGTYLNTGTAVNRVSFILGRSSDYVSAGAAKFRFYHTTSGAGSHTLNLDHVVLKGIETY